MANISQAKKKTWSTPIVRELSGAEAEEARELLLGEREPRKSFASKGLR